MAQLIRPAIRHDQPSRHILWPLFIVSFASLYLEITLIRWLGTEVGIFAFFQNLTLIACFLGFGLGCYWSRQKRNLFSSLKALAILIVLAEAPLGPWQDLLKGLSSFLSLSPDADLWGAGKAPTGSTYWMLFFISAIVVLAFLMLVVQVMIPMGQWVGYYLDEARRPVQAYSINLLGSVAGVWFFALMAHYWLPPLWWFGVAFAILLWIQPHGARRAAVGLGLMAACLILLAYGRGTPGKTYWSPYQKLTLTSYGHSEYAISVNDVGYMTIVNMTPGFLTGHPKVESEYRTRSSYDAPFRFAKSVKNVLIVGAGAGNDAAAALRNGAQHVDAVEIDPVIYYLGKTLHPERPYTSPKVHVIINDARAVLRRTHQRYDVIEFGLLDSHTQFSDYSNMRLDNYVYTEQSFEEAKRLLKPDGILVLKFEVRHPWEWMGQRFYRMFDQLFGRPPVVFYAPRVGDLLQATVFIGSKSPALWQRASEPQLAAIVHADPPHFSLNLADAPSPTTDNWPYVYHRGHDIPRTFLTVSLLLLGLALLLVRSSFKPGKLETWHFFFLGAGFLLLETQMVSRLALYFGTTWLVNCIALTAILLTLVAANFYVIRFRPGRLGLYYLLLIASLIANYIFPWERLSFSASTIGLLLSAAYTVPVFFAGIVFTEMFRRAESKSNAFGANIVGAVAGGLTQNLSFIMGMKLLLVVAAVFYAAASLSRFRWSASLSPKEVPVTISENS